MTFSRATGWLFLATLFSVTFEKVHWSIAGQVALADLLTIAFLASFLLDAWQIRRWPRTVGVVLLFAAFLYYLFSRLAAARRLGRALTEARDPLAARVRPLAWGLTAALVGTMAANIFYLTMSFYYFYAFAALALALPLVFRRSPHAA